jgi:hypothetical protein
MRKTAFDLGIEANLVGAIAPDDEEVDLSSAIAPDTYQLAVSSADRNQFTRGRNGVNGFAIIPIWALREITCARAHHATALTIILLQRMRVRKTNTIPITAAIWTEIGSPGKRERQTILQHLRRVPGVVKLEERRQGYTRYQATLGDMWNQ